MTRGGKREGSGRPSAARTGVPKKVVFALRLPPDVAEWAKQNRKHVQSMIEREAGAAEKGEA